MLQIKSLQIFDLTNSLQLTKYVLTLIGASSLLLKIKSPMTLPLLQKSDSMNGRTITMSLVQCHKIYRRQTQFRHHLANMRSTHRM